MYTSSNGICVYVCIRVYPCHAPRVHPNVNMEAQIPLELVQIG